MKSRLLWLLPILSVLSMGTGCRTPIPPGAEVGPDRTIAHDMLVETSESGVAIEANGEYMGKSPVHLKIFGNIKGTFHDFGSDFFIVRALPAATNQYAQTRAFRTDRDRIPKAIYLDMHQPPPPEPPPGRVYYGRGPHFYFYGPAPYFYGPTIRVPFPRAPFPFPRHR